MQYLVPKVSLYSDIVFMCLPKKLRKGNAAARVCGSSIRMFCGYVYVSDAEKASVDSEKKVKQCFSNEKFSA